MSFYEDYLAVRWKARTDLIWLCNNLLDMNDVSEKLCGTMVSRLFKFPKPTSAEEMRDHDRYDKAARKWIYRPLIVDETRYPALLPDPNKLPGPRRTLTLDSRGFLKCLSGDQEVLVSDGRYVRVDSLLPGHRVLGIRDDFSLEWTDVVAKEEQHPAPCYKITLRSGRTVTSSFNHPFRMIDGWVNAESLKAGDRIAITGKIEPPDATEHVPHAELLGWMLADGCFNKCAITKKNPEHRMLIVEAARRAGFDAEVAGPDTHGNEYVNIRNAKEYRFKRTEGHNLRGLWRKLGLAGATAGTKFIPDAMFRACQEDLRVFLRALFAGDGTCGKYGISYSSKSRRMIDQIQRLLLRFDIFSTIYDVPVNGEMYYQLSITSISQVRRFFDDIGWIKAHRFKFGDWHNPNTNTVPKEWRTLYGKYFFTRGTKPKGLRRTSLTKYGGRKEVLCSIGVAIGDKRLMNLGCDDLYWDCVIAVERIEDRRTWAIETRNHTFAVSDVVSHNTSVVDVAHSVQWIINYPDITILLFQGNLKLARDFLGLVKDNFWRNPKIQQYFPELCVPPDQKEFGNLDEFTTPGRSENYIRKQPTMRARAIEQGGAGQHVEVIKYSDIVNEENSESKEYCAKIADKFYNSHNTLMASGIYWIDVDGTRYSAHDVYGEVIAKERKSQQVKAWKVGREIFTSKAAAQVFSKTFGNRPIVEVKDHYVRDESKRKWNIYINCCYDVAHPNPTFDYEDMLDSDLKFKIGADGLPVSRWPERHPSETLEEERRDIPSIFACQKLNNPSGGDEDRKFHVNEEYPDVIARKVFNEEVHIARYEIAMDTAPTVSRRSDYTAIVVAATDTNGRVFIVEIIHGKFHEDETAEKLLDAFIRYQPSRVLMENDNGNRGIRVWLRRKQEERKIPYVPYVDVPRKMNVKGKKFRISEVLQPWYHSKALRFVVDEIEMIRGEKGSRNFVPLWNSAQLHMLEEFRNLPGDKFHDDIVDAIAMLFHDRKLVGRQTERPKPSVELNKYIMGRRAAMMEQQKMRVVFGEDTTRRSSTLTPYESIMGGL